MEKVLDDYDWIWWIDSDIVIQHDFDVMTLIKDINEDLVISLDPPKLGETCPCTGSFLMKNTKWSKRFLRRWFESPGKETPSDYLDKHPWEQKFIETLYLEKDEDVLSHFKILPYHVLNSCFYPRNFNEKSFSVHFMGQKPWIRRPRMKEICDKFLRELEDAQRG